VKVGIPAHDPVDAMLTHQKRRVDIVEHVAELGRPSAGRCFIIFTFCIRLTERDDRSMMTRMETEMKSKISLIFGVLVLVLSAMEISPAIAAVAPTVNALPAAATTPFLPGESASPSSFLCSLNRSVAPGLPKTEAFPPHSGPATTFLPPCGACSDFACQGRSVNAVCGTSLYCYDFGRTCRVDGQILCRCAPYVP
jgi:hypothetical protein